MSQPIDPLPPVSVPWIDQPGTPSQSFRQYFLTLDALARAIQNFFAAATVAKTTAVASPPMLVNAANDAAAKTAGVGVGQFYRNGSVVQVRVT